MTSVLAALVYFFAEYRFGSEITIVALYPNCQRPAHEGAKLQRLRDQAFRALSGVTGLEISSSGSGPGAGQKAAAVNLRTTLLPWATL